MEEWLLRLVHEFSYLGIFIATTIESTFVPIPAEVTLIPAGILAAKGQMNYWLILLSSTGGVIVGSILNYWVGLRFGRKLITRYGKYLFLKPGFLEKTERFFARYGAMAVFLGRLLPGLKHYIAFVAGIAQMKFKPFVTYTALGGLFWMWLLLQIGYMTERSQEQGDASISSMEIIVLAITVISLLAWLVREKLMKHD